MLYDLLGRFGALFASIPFILFAAMYCVLFGYVGTYLLYLQMSKGNFYVSIVCYCLCYFTRFQLSKKKELLPYLIERQSFYLLLKKKISALQCPNQPLCFGVVMCCGALLYAVHKHELDAQPLRPRHLTLPWHLHPELLPPVHDELSP